MRIQNPRITFREVAFWQTLNNIEQFLPNMDAGVDLSPFLTEPALLPPVQDVSPEKFHPRYTADRLSKHFPASCQTTIEHSSIYYTSDELDELIHARLLVISYYIERTL